MMKFPENVGQAFNNGAVIQKSVATV